MLQIMAALFRFKKTGESIVTLKEDDYGKAIKSGYVTAEKALIRLAGVPIQRLYYRQWLDSKARGDNSKGKKKRMGAFSEKGPN